jgi:hypothetical protein
VNSRREKIDMTETANGESTRQDLFSKLILACGPPRSGTTLLARTLNVHPEIVTMIDDHVHECWAIYYYLHRTGLIDDIRQGRIDQSGAEMALWRHLVRNDRLNGVAPSKKTGSLEPAPPPVRPGGDPPNRQDQKLVRYGMPLADLGRIRHVCLKSPEISFHLPEMAELFPAAKLVISYRPVIEIAESMYRKGLTVKAVKVFWARWQHETDTRGILQAPPGVPPRWQALWPEVSDFERCAIYAASYLWSIVGGLERLPRERFFLYNHTSFRQRPRPVLRRLARFLDVDRKGFAAARSRVSARPPTIPGHFQKQLGDLEEALGLKDIRDRLLHLQGRERE